MILSLIAAISSNSCIGNNGTLPWDLPEDMAHFRNMTKGKPVIMGRKTWESIPEKHRPLPKRTNVIITRQTDYPAPEGVLVFDTIDAAIDSQQNAEEVMIIGGTQIYEQTIDCADRLYITHVDQHVDGDSFFPEIDEANWNVLESKEGDGLTFVTYTRNT